jgi:hypothetical protein
MERDCLGHIIVGEGTDASVIWLLEQFEPRSGLPSWLRWPHRL